MHKLPQVIQPQMEEEYQVDEAINSSEEQELETTPEGNEETEALQVKLAEAEEAKRQLTARAHKAEAEAKALKAKQGEAPQNINSSLSADEVDIKILQSQGVDEDSLNYLKKLAKVNGTSILAAQTDELYVSYKQNKEAKAKSEQASLGASRGSGQARKVKSFGTPDLETQDHKELWLKQKG